MAGSIPLGSFELTRPLGRGGMAEVWQGLHIRQGVPVAVKVMSGRATRDPQARAAFRQEVQAVAGLDHAGIVMVFDHGETGREAEEASKGFVPAGRPYLVMELAGRGTLRDVRAGLTWNRVRSVLLDLLEALAHAHARGVVHRDLKPSNVLAFGGDDYPAHFKLADFGLAYAVGRGARDESGGVSGTPAYMAPEQILGHWRDDGPWTDLYALGCMAFELACGRAVFAETTLNALADAHLYREPPPLAPLLPVPPGFEGWIRRLLRKDPRERFQRAADAAHGLRALGSAGGGGKAAIALDERPTAVDLQAPAPASAVPAEASATREALVPRPLAPFPATWRRSALPAPSPALHGVGLGLHGLRPIPFVGREDERDLLWRALGEVVSARRPRFVLLQGMAGSGKSRLAEWLAERAHEVGHANVMDAPHGPMAGPGRGLSRMIARFLRCHGLHAADLLARTETLLRGQGVDDAEEWRTLATLIDSTTPATPTLSARERHGAARRLLRLLTRKRPMIVRLDDVHWGADSLDFARGVLAEADDEPLAVLFLATAREEVLVERPAEAAALQAVLDLPGATRLLVGPLPEADQRALVEQMLGLAGDTVAQIVERTGGNPLFAVHLVSDWVQRGVLVPAEEGFVLREGEEAPLPDDLHQVWSERMARLLEGRLPHDREALEIAAALGPEVFPAEWQEACRQAGLAAPGGFVIVDALVAARLARRTEMGWAFTHGMLRESVERLAREAGRWAAHHRACAAMLEERFRAGELRVAERLAGHRLGAQEPEAAAAPFLQAARERRETSEYRRARTLLDRRDEALRATLASEDDPRWGEGWTLRARIALHEGRLDEATRWADGAAAAAVRHGWTLILSEALRLLGDAARRQGSLTRAAELYGRCVALLDRLDNPHGPAASWWGLGDVHRQRGALEEALSAFARSRALYLEIGDHHGVADYLIGVADVAWQQGEWEEAEVRYREAQQAFDALGNRYGVARALNGRGEVARARGELGDARAHYARSRALLNLVDSADEIFPAINLALLDLAEGQLAAAQAALLGLRDELRAREWRALLACVQSALLPCLAAGGDWPGWDDALSEAAAILGPEGIVEPDVAWAVRLGAEAARRQGQEERARAAERIDQQAAPRR